MKTVESTRVSAGFGELDRVQDGKPTCETAEESSFAGKSMAHAILLVLLREAADLLRAAGHELHAEVVERAARALGEPLDAAPGPEDTR